MLHIVMIYYTRNAIIEKPPCADQAGRGKRPQSTRKSTAWVDFTRNPGSQGDEKGVDKGRGK